MPARTAGTCALPAIIVGIGTVPNARAPQLDAGVDDTGQQIDAGQQAGRSQSYVFVIAGLRRKVMGDFRVDGGDERVESAVRRPTSQWFIRGTANSRKL